MTLLLKKGREMTSMMTERQNGSAPESAELYKEIEDLKKAQAVQAATDAGAHATQAATQAGATATQAAAQAGLWSTFMTGGAALVVGMLLGVLFTSVGRSND